jgi:hypothetical protein
VGVGEGGMRMEVGDGEGLIVQLVVGVIEGVGVVV